MRVQRLIMPSGPESWTVLDDDGLPVPAVEGYLAHLWAIERSPNTVRAYAHSLKLWLEFLATRKVGLDEAGVEDVSRFAGWLRSPADGVLVLPGGSAARAETTTNRHLAGVFGFYEHRARCGVQVAAGLLGWRRGGRGSFKPFLHQISRGRPGPARPVRLRVTTRLPRTLSEEQVTAILAASGRLRDRFLLALLAESGMRVDRHWGCGTPTS